MLKLHPNAVHGSVRLVLVRETTDGLLTQIVNSQQMEMAVDTILYAVIVARVAGFILVLMMHN